MKMELEGIEKQKKLEELRNKLELRIRWKNGDRIVFASRSNTLYQLFEIIWNQFQLFNEEDFQSYELDVIKDTKSDEDSNSTGLNSIKCKGGVKSSGSGGSEEKKNDIDNIDTCVDVKNANQDKSESKNENMINKVIDNHEKTSENKITGNYSEEKIENNLKEEKETESDGPRSSSFHTVPLTVTNYSKTSNTVLFSAKIAENMRLRLYNASAKTASEAFDATSIFKTLESLSFNSYRPLILETKKSTNSFEVYYADGFNILLEEFDLELKDFKEVRSVRMPKLGTLTDLKSKSITQYCILYYIILYYIILYYIILYYIILYHIILYIMIYIVFYYIFYFILLYFI
jgi:hypothetical protein